MRKANLIQTSIWQNADFQAQPPDAKLVYLLLLTQPSVAATGALPVVTAAWAHVLGITERRVTSALRSLVDGRFVWHDATFQELVIRSWIRHNVEGSPKMETAARDQLGAIASPTIRARLTREYPTVYPTDTVSHTLSDTLSESFAEQKGSSPLVEPKTGTLDTLSDTPSAKTPNSRGVEGRGTEGSGTSSSIAAREAVDAVWAAYSEHHPRATLTRDRRSLIQRRITQGYDAATLIAAIHGNHRDAYCNGENQAGREYHDLGLILRSADHIERYANTPINGHAHKPLSAAGKSLALANQLAAEGR